jgi:hypothetical protein
MDRKTEILAYLPIFADPDPRSAEAIATLAKVVSVPAGTVLLREGDTAESLMARFPDVSARVEAAVARRPHPSDA